MPPNNENKPMPMTWSNRLRKMIRRSFHRQLCTEICEKYLGAFSADYQSLMPPRYAVSDIFAIEKTLQTQQSQVGLLSPGSGQSDYRLHFYGFEARYLDEFFPVLQNLNIRVIDQVQFPLTINQQQIYIKSFTICSVCQQCTSFRELSENLLALIRAVLNGKVENDELNGLLVLTGLTWQQIDVLRAYRNYLLQLGYKTTRDSFHHTLNSNPHVAFSLFRYFDARFNPETEWSDNLQREENALFPLRLQLLEAIESVPEINHDRILRTLFNLIDATVRSNFYVRQGLEDFFISIKINSLGVIDMPGARPQNEIYVHSVEMEGIHLRGGKVSRGGIRWSDRIDDFRTEILGLMQTQMSKNVLIIPKGAKGGFIVKKDCVDECFREAGQQAYQIFIQGLLDLTDNYVDDQVVTLPGIISYDDTDPYLVVAADKGTAQFSDLANTVAAQYQFWLADAFASGGSHGYNHKKLGITARGAWESVKRHFREIGKDIQRQPFTVVGIGSMDGDVFGNGMLLSPYTQLLAAFSGQHIFIDPQPVDLQASFKERKRLFELPRSTWDDYDRGLISAGGGVYRRDAKAIAITPEVKKWLGIRHNSLDGESLMQCLLKAPVELLWLGGVGAYVKAADESHADVGDRDNDAVRVDAGEIQAAVVGEGANLGFTRKARVEYSLKGGRINTDAVDNSAGVDISDHEVNLKILLMRLFRQQKIAGYTEFFAGLTGSVVNSVLRNNYQQTLCLSLEQLRCEAYATDFMQVADQLEIFRYLDRIKESFPSEKQWESRSGFGLTRPELASLMAAAKMFLTEQLLEQTDLIKQAEFNGFLLDYFPSQVSQSFSDDVLSHPLARQIKATCLSNKIINQAGCLFLSLSLDDKNKLIENCLSYFLFDQIINADSLRELIYDSDGKINADQQYQALLNIEAILLRFCRWSMLNQQTLDFQNINYYQSCLQDYRFFFQQQLKSDENNQNRIVAYQQDGFTQSLAEQICFIDNMSDFPYLISRALPENMDFSGLLSRWYEINNLLGLDVVYVFFRNLTPTDYWEQKVALSLENDIKWAVVKFIREMTALNRQSDDCFSSPQGKEALTQYQQLRQKIQLSGSEDLMPYITLKEQLLKLLNID